MSCIDLRETSAERDERVDCMLREMVVLEGLESLSEERPPRTFTLEEIGDFVGVTQETIRRFEERALREVRNLMLV